MRIACLHTADSNVAVFDAAAQAIGLAPDVLAHTVRADLLSAAERAGGLTAAIAAETGAALQSLCGSANAVVLTCSTLGPSVAALAGTVTVPVLRVDAALAEAAVANGGRVVALCAVETTVEPTTRLFADAAAMTGAAVEVQLVPGAWELFKAGARDRYLAAIAKAADDAYTDGASVVVLAQASMAGAADLVRNGPPPLTSPTAGLAAALRQASQPS